ncbi:S8 family serine peptidase [Tenacibaculum maritimum]|uniref:S8 family serine peptidase n=1 Tax=Tenacibaculum maritimum TaxID=107401 RepID=UPI0012E4D4B9|nr:S8 family serine peptidase [Tenacibaculum maritimum]CAA0216594.1 Probable S8 family protease precursor containing a C-terminal secretion signal [Tenacibaculum maritimum]
MKKLLLFLLTAYTTTTSYSQEDAWIFLKDKPNAATFIANPLTMLSQRSLDRRARQNINIDNKDVPIDAGYYVQIKNKEGITVKAKSKWLNAIHVQGNEAVIRALETDFNFIDKIEFANKNLSKGRNIIAKSNNTNRSNKFAEITTNFDYGNAANQIQMLKGDFLHREGFTGTGMQIAIIDAGFPNVNTLAGFKRLRDNNQILGGYDFVNRNVNFYTGHSHGTHVLSDIGGYIEGSFVGTAPDASFYLFISEDAANEVPLEESLWVEAAERADSLGVDVINTSLGYTTFDNAKYNYTYADMDGKTAFITRGAEIGVSRGMILVNAAGNSGNDSWKYIGVPADAPSVFTIGAVNSSKGIASFSSYGPTSDGRVKPDVLAQGQSAYVIDYRTGTPRTTNGTSFSSPIMAGVVACFWQAFPNKTHAEIVDIIKKSADRYNAPDDRYGYGIPNFELAKQTLSVNLYTLQDLGITIYPNPVDEYLNFKIDKGSLEDYKVKVFSVLGKQLFFENKRNSMDISSLKSGVYILELSKGALRKTVKLIKK